MNRLYLTGMIFIMLLALPSCAEKDNAELQVIRVDFDEDESLPLSVIADNIVAVEPEVTEKSLIGKIQKALLCNDYIIIHNLSGGRYEIMLFDKHGKFIRQTGSMGQGPGEFTQIRDLTVDVENELIYVASARGLICYDLDGHVVAEASSPVFSACKYMNHENGTLQIISEYYGEKDESGAFNRSMLYTVDSDLKVTDSLLIRKVYLERIMAWIHPFRDFTTQIGKDTYLYFSEQNVESFVRDTLYKVQNHRLVPSLKLQFKDNGVAADGVKCIYLFNAYRSSRFVFAVYGHDRRSEFYRFCYDTETGKGYNMKDGYTDDIHGIEERVSLRPFDSDADRFYFFHTRADTDISKAEPNPTLYIGTLKK
ncbi:MAG: 6-bladed beta-propeller [Tannerella sp.]|jgi:hypothetical protein|nr:6-bladed beta-propeller [Tannerella sp.]